MRQYVWFNKAGEIKGTSTTTGGFPEDKDLLNEDDDHPRLKAHRDAHKGEPDWAGFAEFICECPSEDESCPCVHNAVPNYYMKNGKIVDKPDVTILLDDAPTAEIFNRESVDYPPRTSVKFALEGDVPDGHQILMRNSGRVHIAKRDETLTFKNGKTQTITLRTPAQGLEGTIVGQSLYVGPLRIALRGWE